MPKVTTPNGDPRTPIAFATDLYPGKVETDVVPQANGRWIARLTIPKRVALGAPTMPGHYPIGALCYATEGAEAGLVNYQAASFTVTSSDLPDMRASTAPAVPLTSLPIHGVTITYPASWHAVQPSSQPTIGVNLVDLSNQPLHDPCTSTITPSGLTTACAFPLARLESDSVLMRWSLAEEPGLPEGSAFLDSQPGKSFTVGGQPGKLATRPPTHDECGGLGASRVMAAAVVNGADRYVMTACITGPSVRTVAAQIRGVLFNSRF